MIFLQFLGAVAIVLGILWLVRGTRFIIQRLGKLLVEIFKPFALAMLAIATFMVEFICALGS